MRAMQTVRAQLKDIHLKHVRIAREIDLKIDFRSIDDGLNVVSIMYLCKNGTYNTCVKAIQR